MSKGPGRIELAIAAILDRSPDNAFTTEELCVRIYRTKQVEKKHRIAVRRAADSLAKRRDTLRKLSSRNLGRSQIYYNGDRLMSAAMANLKGNSFNHYCSNHDERIFDHQIMTEKELRAKLTNKN
jgi:hypothetical protein